MGREQYFMNRLILSLFIILFSFGFRAQGQDTLPKFSVKNLGNNHIIISWLNNYDLLKQLSIQTSRDSATGYRTLITVTDPNSKENGYDDSKALNDHMFYRLFIVKGNGEFFLTDAKQPIFDTFALPLAEQGAKQYGKRPDYVPSFYVYTNPENYVYINLPDADRKKYRIKFFEEDDTFLFEIKSIKETGLTLDKAIFVHAGWFKFELYQEDKLIEKNKIYLSKEF
jgi:hypothetical protein